MSRLPTLKPKEVVRVLEKLGFKQHRQKGSHLIMIKEGNNVCQPVIPMYNKDIRKATLLSIIRQAGLIKENFIKYL